MKIEIKNLKKQFGSKVLFENLSLDIPERKSTCIFGKSGCGKTTLLNLIGFLEPYSSGEILYDGILIKRSSEIKKMLREKIGFIFQDFGLIENETVLENIKLVKRIRQQKNYKEKVDEVLNTLNLSNVLNRKVFELSGGEQQRVAIAKIILKDPDLVLADEPTASLDDDNKIVILNLMRKFVDNGKTVVVVSHDDNVIQWADNAIDLSKLKEGEV